MMLGVPAEALHAELKRQGYDCAYSRATDLLRWAKPTQFDWSEEGKVGGIAYLRAGRPRQTVRQPCLLAGGLS